MEILRSQMTQSGTMKIAAIVPTYNGGEQLRECLQGIAGSDRKPDQVVVVDDGSIDGSAAAAEEFGFEILTLSDGPRGPARARNHGVHEASGADVLFFVDADVVVHPDTLTRVEQHLVENPGVAALFGSYDQSPPARATVSLYKKLLHHYVHQTSKPEASTFWAGCGAIRRAAFHDVGGFNETYTRPSIEDIELGARLRKAGYRIRLFPDVQATHLKRWTFGSLIRTDILCRAIPWSRMLINEGELVNDLNLSVTHRLAAVSAILLVASIVLSWWMPALAAVLAVVAGTAFVYLNIDLLRFFARKGGTYFVLAAAGLHLLYYLYSTGAFVWVRIQIALERFWGKLFRHQEA